MIFCLRVAISECREECVYVMTTSGVALGGSGRRGQLSRKGGHISGGEKMNTLNKTKFRVISFTNFNAQFHYSLTICMLHYSPRHV